MKIGNIEEVSLFYSSFFIKICPLVLSKQLPYIKLVLIFKFIEMILVFTFE